MMRAVCCLLVIACFITAHATKPVNGPLDVDCPDGSSCPDDNTCCPLDATNSSYGCCPSPNATCCSDFEHCCPEDYPVCDLSSGECTTNTSEVRIRWLRKTPSVFRPLDVDCPDGSSCPDDNTCCALDATNSSYGCCPSPNATCCSDYEHCCPEDYPVCDLSSGECTTNTTDGHRIPMLKKIPSRFKPLDVDCPDGSSCPDDNTCCALDATNSSYGCCPSPNATCCSDYEHCCPEDYPVCDLSSGECTTNTTDGDRIPMLKKLPSRFRPLDVDCPDGSSCPDDNTCCALDATNSSYGCCPSPNATCCSDYEHCCPEDYPVCDLSSGECTTNTTQRVNILSQTPSRFHPLDVDCPDGSSCPDDNTCCALDATNSSYGCCPSPNATCCSDYEHCCPEDYPVCDLSSGECTTNTTNGKSVPMLRKFAALRPLDVDCPDGSSCPDDNTCCPLDASGSSYGCCPSPNATCCSDFQHCCPEDYPVCDLSSGECTTNSTSIARIPWLVKSKPMFL